MPGLAWPGLAWPGLAWPGLAWPGLAWPGLERIGLADISRKCAQPMPALLGDHVANFLLVCAGQAKSSHRHRITPTEPVGEFRGSTAQS